MAPIKISEIIKVSSEDQKFPASNLLHDKKWMSDSIDQTGEGFIEFAFEQPMQIHYIDIGYFNIGLMEIHVSASSWPSYREHVTLLPTVMLQSSMDARTGRNKTGCKMFNFAEHLNQEVAKQHWDRVKLTLHQPHARNKQFGIEFIRCGTPRNISAPPSNKKESSMNKRVETSPATASWKNSPLAKLIPNSKQSLNSSNSQLLESKLRHMSGTVEGSGGSLMGRTAKMVMASKLKTQNLSSTPTSRLDNPDKPQTPKSQRHLLARRSLELSNSAKTPERSNKQDRRSETPVRVASSPSSSYSHSSKVQVQTEVKENASGKAGNERGRQISKSIENHRNTNEKATMEKDKVEVTIKNANSINKKTNFTKDSNVGRREKLTTSKGSSSKSLSNSNFIAPQKVATDATNELTKQKIYSSEALSVAKRSVVGTKSLKSLNTLVSKLDKSDDDVKLVENEMKEPVYTVYTDEQVRQLKKAIKRYFNLLDMDSFDPDTQKVRDLRRNFEHGHNIKLNKDGRKYFADVTARFMSLAFSSQKHKQKDEIVSNKVVEAKGAIKRKSSETEDSQSTACVVESPAKQQRRISDVVVTGAISATSVQCPLCFDYFNKDVINLHAEYCALNDGASTSQFSAGYSGPHQNGATATGTVVDCSDNSCLSYNEQQKWIQYSKEPKPYQERLNRSDYAGCLLSKCPSCGQKYKSTEIAIHSDECTEKVNSGYTRMGMYLVKDKKGRKQKNKSKIPSGMHEAIVLD